MVNEFLVKHDFKHTYFDGCMYDLVTKYTGVATLPIRHPWKLAYINCDIGKYLNVICDRSHRHAPCSGKEALYSQGYTPQICEMVRKCFMNMKMSSCIFVSVNAELEGLPSQAIPAKAASPACACIAMAAPPGSVWDEVPRALLPLRWGRRPGLRSKTQKRRSNVWDLTRGRRALRPSHPGLQKRAKGCLRRGRHQSREGCRWRSSRMRWRRFPTSSRP